MRKSVLLTVVATLAVFAGGCGGLLEGEVVESELVQETQGLAANDPILCESWKSDGWVMSIYNTSATAAAGRITFNPTDCDYDNRIILPSITYVSTNGTTRWYKSDRITNCNLYRIPVTIAVNGNTLTEYRQDGAVHRVWTR